MRRSLTLGVLTAGVALWLVSCGDDAGLHCAHGVRGDTMLDPEWVVVERGAYSVAPTASERDRGVPQVIELTYRFAIQTSEVTAGERERVTLLFRPDSITRDGERLYHPAQFTIFSALYYADRRSALDGFEPCYGIEAACPPYGDRQPNSSDRQSACADALAQRGPLDCEGYRIPTSAEWEIAASIGWDPGCTGDAACVEQYANTERGNTAPDSYSSRAIASVGQFCPNGLGLYDTLGNVFEHVMDTSDPYGALTYEDPSYPIRMLPRVYFDNETPPYLFFEDEEQDGSTMRRHREVRGGSSDVPPEHLHPGRVFWGSAWNQLAGLRLVRTLPDE